MYENRKKYKHKETDKKQMVRLSLQKNAYQTKRHRTRLQYMTLILLYLIHKEEDYAYSMSKTFRNNSSRAYPEINHPNKLSSLLKSMYNLNYLNKETRKVKGKERTYYSLVLPAFAHIFAIHYNSDSIVSVKPDPLPTEEWHKLTRKEIDEILHDEDLKQKKIFEKITYENLYELLMNIQYYSKKIDDNHLMKNITPCVIYDFNTFFLHILDILEVIFQYKTGIHPRTELKKHYFLRKQSESEINEMIKVFEKNQLFYLIEFTKETLVNSIRKSRYSTSHSF